MRIPRVVFSAAVALQGRTASRSFFLPSFGVFLAYFLTTAVFSAAGVRKITTVFSAGVGKITAVFSAGRTFCSVDGDVGGLAPRGAY